MPVSPARTAAFDILLKVREQDAFASELLHSSRLDRLALEDRGLCMELVMGTLRWQAALDIELAQYSSIKPNRIDAEVLIALRLAIYQIRHLDRVPSRAAVNESVELVKAAHKKSAAPFVNAVLRKIAASAAEPHTVSAMTEEPVEEIAIRYAHPHWLVALWVLEFGLAGARKICEHDQCVPPVTLRIFDASAERELAAQNIKLEKGALLNSALRVLAGDIVHSRAFLDGRVVIQDEASQLIAMLVGNASRLLDCCAAPGGKTAILAERNPMSTIIAIELHEHRARLLRERIRASNVQVIAADATNLPYGPEFERILVDVPCSGTGTLARNPEIKWKLCQQDFHDLHERQVRILSAALSHLVPGGQLLYSTCSLESIENESVIDEALSNVSGYSLLNCAGELEKLGDELAVAPETLVRNGYLRIIPGMHPCDGFFAAIIKRD